MTDLLPCPFCGGTAVFTNARDGRRYSFRVRCADCGAEAGGTVFQNDDWNAERWNKRSCGALTHPAQAPDAPQKQA